MSEILEWARPVLVVVFKVTLLRILISTVILLVVLIGLVVLGVALYSAGMEKLNRSYPNIPVETVSVPADPNAVSRGKHVATIWGCTRCHGSTLSGSVFTSDPIDGIVPLFGTIPAANLTSGKGGVAKSYSETDWVRAIRHGVKPNGWVEVFMYDYSTMSNRDLGDLIAYLKQLAPVDAEYPPANYGPILPVAEGLGVFTPPAQRIDHGALRVADAVPATTRGYGKYLSAVCAECHGAGLVAPLQGTWKQEEFVRTLRTGVLPNGRQMGAAMPASLYGEMNDTELTALWLYYQNPPLTQAR